MDLLKIIGETMEDEAALEAFGEEFMQQFLSDEEPYHKKFGRLLQSYLDDEILDDVFVTLTGWSLETLLKNSRGETV